MLLRICTIFFVKEQIMLKKIFLSSAILLLASGCGILNYNSAGNSVNFSKYKKEMNNSADTVFFKFNNSTLAAEAESKLDFQVDNLKRNGDDSKITVTGFCDERGTREYNIALGERRANSVKKYLVSKGISEGRIIVDSMGKDALRCDTTNPIYNVVEGDLDIYHQQNRRTLITKDQGTIDHNMIAQEERKRCISVYDVSEIGKDVDEKVTTDNQTSEVIDSNSSAGGIGNWHAVDDHDHYNDHEEENFLGIVPDSCDNDK